MTNGPIRVKQVNQSSAVIGHIDELASTLLMKAWPGGLLVGMLGDLPAMFSLVTGRGEFTFHIWILGQSEVCAVS